MNIFSDEIFSAIVFVARQPEDMVLQNFGTDELHYTLGDGGYVISFVRSEGKWFIDQVNGQSVGIRVNSEDEGIDLFDRLNEDSEKQLEHNK